MTLPDVKTAAPSVKSQQSSVAIFCTPEIGHFQALRAVATGIAARGLPVYFFTHADFRSQVEEDGLSFVDLFSRYPLDHADNQSIPVPCRYVSFAGHYAEPITELVRILNPSLIIYETFSVIAPVVARALGVPYVNVCVNHNAVPQRVLAALENDKRVAISQKCLHAVRKLREHFGMTDASAFSYVSSLSPLLNIYCEPVQFLDDNDRQAFEPVAFFGCLRDSTSMSPLAADQHPYFGDTMPDELLVYVSFGTVIWKYFAREAVTALQVISQTSAAMNHVRVVISLGGANVASEVVDQLRRANVSVVPYVDQWKILEKADLFLTHHGLNSTHEAIFHRVPMISYPFFSDQPALAQTCQRLGIAIPLTKTLRAPPTVNEVKAAISNFLNNKRVLHANLQRAYAWEKETLDGRRLVIQRIMDLMPRRSNPGWTSARAA